MKRQLLGIATVILVTGLFVAGASYRHWSGGSSRSSSGGRQILYYVDPMNPAHKTPGPGMAPCGMKMEPVYADQSSFTPAAGVFSSVSGGSIAVSPAKRQLSGVQVAELKMTSIRHSLRWPGRIELDQTRVYQINAALDGRVVKVQPYGPGSVVKKNDVLASYYSPEFLHAAQVLVFGLKTEEQMAARKQAGPQRTNFPIHSIVTEPPPQSEAIDKLPQYTYADQLSQFANNDQLSQSQQTIKLNLEALRNFGMGDVQVQEMIRTRKPLDRIDLVAPADGLVLARNVSLNQAFQKGVELYRVADLSRVWIEVTVLAADAESLHAGVPVRVTPAHGQRSYPAVISDAPSRFDEMSRTLKVRLEANNADYELKPGMPVDVELVVEIPQLLAVPADAVLDSGLRKLVYVEEAPGVFKARPVKTGRSLGGQVEIVGGLKPGERIATTGNFLIDSESRIQMSAVGNPGQTEVDVVCGMAVDPDKAGIAGYLQEYAGRVWYFCSTNCQQTFHLSPGPYTQKPDLRSAADPWCGRTTNSVEEITAARRLAGSTASHPGGRNGPRSHD